MTRPTFPPDPPIEMPPARTVRVPGRGEFFVRDSGGDGPAVMLLHGWMASSDLNWWGAYDDLASAGYRVLGIDHRGHGRGLRAMTPFRLSDCADDAAAVLRGLGIEAALVVGYSMGGAIAQRMALDYAGLVRGLVLSGTAQHWQDRRTQRSFRALGLLGLSLSLAPRATYRIGLRRSGIPSGPRAAWLQAELMRHAAQDITEAGRELGRFDSRPWLGQLQMPVAVVLTTRDELVAPRKQHALAVAAGAEVFDVPLTHMELGWRANVYNPALLRALASVEQRASASDAPALPVR
jgi:3-oxoadipate enol-lactonase